MPIHRKNIKSAQSSACISILGTLEMVKSAIAISKRQVVSNISSGEKIV